MNWYVLFIRNGAEDYVLRQLKNHLDSEAYTPFVPLKEYPQSTKGVKSKVRKTCFPGGYVFLRSSENPEGIIKNVSPLVNGIKDAYYFLSYGDDRGDIAMRDYERGCIERLLNDEFCMEASIGFTEGEKVTIISGPLVGMESQVVKINRRKRTAVVEVPFVGNVRQITLMLEVLQK